MRPRTGRATDVGRERLGVAAGSAVAVASVADGSFGVPADDADRTRHDHGCRKPAGAISDHVEVCNHRHRVQRLCCSKFLRAFTDETRLESARRDERAPCRQAMMCTAHAYSAPSRPAPPHSTGCARFDRSGQSYRLGPPRFRSTFDALQRPGPLPISSHAPCPPVVPPSHGAAPGGISRECKACGCSQTLYTRQSADQVGELHESQWISLPSHRARSN